MSSMREDIKSRRDETNSSTFRNFKVNYRQKESSTSEQRKQAQETLRSKITDYVIDNIIKESSVEDRH